MANIYSEDFKFKPALEEIKDTDGWLVALAKIAGETIKDAAKTKTGVVAGTLFAADTIASGSSSISSVFTNISNSVMAAAPDVIPTIQNVAGALFEAANTDRQERSKVIKLDPKLKKLFFAAPMKKYIKSECDKLFSAAKAKDGTVTKEVVGASTNAAKSLVGKKEQEVRKKISKFREVTMTIDGYDLIVFGRKDGISRVAVVFFSQAKKTPILKTIKIPSTEDLKKGKAVKEAAEDIEMILPVDEGWKNFIKTTTKYQAAGGVAGGLIGLALSKVCPAEVAVPLCVTSGVLAGTYKLFAVTDKKFKSMLEQPAIKGQIVDSCKKAFDEAKKEDKSVTKDFDSGIKDVLKVVKDEAKRLPIKQRLMYFNRAKMVLDGWTIIAFGDTETVYRVSLVLWSNEKKQAVVKALPVPNLSKEEVKECAIYLESLYPEHFVGASFAIDMEAIRESLDELSNESQTVVTEGLMDKAKDIWTKFNTEIKPKLIEKLQWLWGKIMDLIQRLNIFTKTKVEKLHIEVGDYKTLNELSGGISMVMNMASKVSDRKKVHANVEKLGDLADKIYTHKSSPKEIKTSDVKRWLDELSKLTATMRDALKETGNVMMSQNSTEEEFEVYLEISSTVLTPVMSCIGEDINKISLALTGKPAF